MKIVACDVIPEYRFIWSTQIQEYRNVCRGAGIEPRTAGIVVTILNVDVINGDIIMTDHYKESGLKLFKRKLCFIHQKIYTIKYLGNYIL